MIEADPNDELTEQLGNYIRNKIEEPYGPAVSRDKAQSDKETILYPYRNLRG